MYVSILIDILQLISAIITALDHANHAKEDYTHSIISHKHASLFAL